MAEVRDKLSPLKRMSQGIKWFFYKEASSFSDKSTISWKRIGFVGAGFLGVFIVLVFVFGADPQKVTDFAEKKQTQSQSASTASQNKPSQTFGSGPSDYGYSTQAGSSNSGGSTKNRNTPMILARAGDTSNQLPPGTKFLVALADNATITSQSQPVIGLVNQDVVTDYGVAIPKGAKIFGEASFDKDSKRARVQWRTLLLDGGQSKTISGIALGSDNQPGIDGEVHSDGVKNTAGALITRFVAGVAEGSVTRTQTGESTGGIQNGLLTGVSDTARERADSWAEDLKKERAWIELKKGDQAQVILIEGFTYRDPGGIH